MALSQGLHQKQLLKLSPQQIQLMKLIQMPVAQLEERIKDELEENPALEEQKESEFEDQENTDEFASDDTDELNTDSESSDEPENEGLDLSEYADDDDTTPDYKTKDEHYPEMDDDRVIPRKMELSFNELMMQQLGMLSLNERELIIAEQIVGSLDDDGYLRREIISILDDLAFRQNLDVSEQEITEIIHKVQQLEPAGIAARDLRECLLIQLERKENPDKQTQQATRIIRDYFDEFTKKHYEKICKSLNVTMDQLKSILQIIVKLNPRPGDAGVEQSNHETYIIPDFYIHNLNGKLELSLNTRNSPDLHISEGYREMLRSYERGAKTDKRQKEAVLFIKQKIDSAKWFIDAIKQRQETLFHSMYAIMQHQQTFFLSGDESDLKPMILKDIAEKTGLDISTISRVANSKYVQTEFGTFRLKYFFSESIQTESGEEVSTYEVKKFLTEIIDSEDKQNPLSDEQLTDLLQEKGYTIARRTVAKYREMLNIPVARMRKEI